MNKTKIITANGTVLNENEIEYRRMLIKDSGSIYCPITHKVLIPIQGESLFINGTDYFISDDGIKILKKIFGDEFIKDRVITYD